MSNQKVSKHMFRVYKELYYKCETYGVGVMMPPFMITDEESVIDNISKVWILEYLIKHKLVSTVEHYVVESLHNNQLRLASFFDVFKNQPINSAALFAKKITITHIINGIYTWGKEFPSSSYAGCRVPIGILEFAFQWFPTKEGFKFWHKHNKDAFFMWGVHKEKDTLLQDTINHFDIIAQYYGQGTK